MPPLRLDTFEKPNPQGSEHWSLGDREGGRLGTGAAGEGRDMADVFRGQRGCKVKCLERYVSTRGRWWWACPAGQDELRRAPEFSPGFTALAAGQVKVGACKPWDGLRRGSRELLGYSLLICE